MSHSATRWRSKFEVINQVLNCFGHIPTFVNGEGLPEATARKLQAIINNSQQLAQLKVELAVTVDVMMPFVRATYDLEGDGPLSLIAYEVTRKLQAEMRNHHFLNCSAVIRATVNGNIALHQSVGSICIGL